MLEMVHHIFSLFLFSRFSSSSGWSYPRFVLTDRGNAIYKACGVKYNNKRVWSYVKNNRKNEKEEWAVCMWERALAASERMPEMKNEPKLTHTRNIIKIWSICERQNDVRVMDAGMSLPYGVALLSWYFTLTIVCVSTLSRLSTYWACDVLSWNHIICVRLMFLCNDTTHQAPG